MRDFLPQDKARREAVAASIRRSFTAYGYREIETPALEDLGRLEASEGGDNEKLIYKVQRRGLAPDVPVLPGDAADLGLRYDLTVPLARFYATHRAELPDVFRSIQIAPAWRAERPQKGRYRQFTQCDIDVLGEASVVAEVELIAAGTAAISELGVGDVVVRINDRRILNALLGDFGVPEAARSAVLVSIDKLDKIGVAGVAEELARLGQGGAAGDVAGLVGWLEKLAGSGESVAGTGRAGVGVGESGAGAGGSGAGDGGSGVGAGASGHFEGTLDLLPGAAGEAAAPLRAIHAALRLAAPGVRLAADPTLVRGQGYYTGPIFELLHPDVSGSIGGGGRYDGMIGRFAGADVPACGLSIGFERIVDLVDPAALAGGRRQVAIVYEAGVDPGVLLAWQRRLIAEDADVRVVPRIRNQARLLDGLAGEGFTEVLDLPGAAAAPAPGEPLPALRTLRPAGGRQP